MTQSHLGMGVMEKPPLPKRQDTKGWGGGSGPGASAARKTALTELWERDGDGGSPGTAGVAALGCPGQPRPSPTPTGLRVQREESPQDA